MGGVIPVDNYTTAGVTHKRRSNFVVSARWSYDIFRNHLIVVSLGRVGRGEVIIGSSLLSSRNRLQKRLRAARCSSQNLIARDCRVACIGFGPAEMDD